VTHAKTQTIATAAELRAWAENPPRFVREQFGVTPDPWQDDVLAAFPHRSRLAMKACKGPGKTAVLAWLAWNFLATRPEPKIAATSITADNLADNLWAEMAKWQARSPLLQAQFQWTKTRIFSRQKPETWWMSARSWARTADRLQQGNTLAGLHADYILFILDESGGIPDAVMASAEAALASCVEGHIVQAGTPTHLEGPLWRACTGERRLWHVTEISADPDDPRRATRVSARWAREQIEKYGRDNPWVMINVFGRFPPAALNTLIGPDDCSSGTDRRRLIHRGGHGASEVLCRLRQHARGAFFWKETGSGSPSMSPRARACSADKLASCRMGQETTEAPIVARRTSKAPKCRSRIVQFKKSREEAHITGRTSPWPESIGSPVAER
jgi:hypothetical protein